MRRLLLGLLVLAGAATLRAQDAPALTLEVGSVLETGTAFEYVLRGGTTNTPYDNPVSRLTWPLPPSLGVSFGADLDWTGWTRTRVTLQATWPLASGTMIDEDWNALTSATNLLLYGHSTHQGYLTTNWSGRAEQVFGTGGLALGAGALYRWSQWEGWNGEGTYREQNTTTQAITISTYTFTGLLISYRQQWLIPYLTAAYTWQADGWSLTPTLRLSPYTFCWDQDNHNYAGSSTTTFLDTVVAGVYGLASIELSFPAEGAGSWGLRLEGEASGAGVGDTLATSTYQSSTGVTAAYTTYANGAGAWFRSAALTVFMRN